MRPVGRAGSNAGRMGFLHKSGTLTKRKKSGNRRIAVGPTRQNKSVRKRGKMGNTKIISSMRK